MVGGDEKMKWHNEARVEVTDLENEVDERAEDILFRR